MVLFGGTTQLLCPFFHPQYHGFASLWTQINRTYRTAGALLNSRLQPCLFARSPTNQKHWRLHAPPAVFVLFVDLVLCDITLLPSIMSNQLMHLSCQVTGPKSNLVEMGLCTCRSKTRATPLAFVDAFRGSCNEDVDDVIPPKGMREHIPKRPKHLGQSLTFTSSRGQLDQILPKKRAAELAAAINQNWLKRKSCLQNFELGGLLFVKFNMHLACMQGQRSQASSAQCRQTNR